MMKYYLAWMLGIWCLTNAVHSEACEWWQSRYAQNYPPVVAQPVLVYNIPVYTNSTTLTPLIYLPNTTCYYVNNPVVAQTVWVPTTYNVVSTQIVYKPYTVYKY